jgi:hypothetical protein
VNEEIAHPAQDLSFDVPIRAASLGVSVLAVAGIAVSAIELLKLRMRCRYKSRVLFAWSLTSLGYSVRADNQERKWGLKTKDSLLFI